MIRVFQCKDDCCLVRIPSKRFWYVDAGKGGLHTVTSFADAITVADRYLTEPTA